MILSIFSNHVFLQAFASKMLAHAKMDDLRLARLDTRCSKLQFYARYSLRLISFALNSFLLPMPFAKKKFGRAKLIISPTTSPIEVNPILFSLYKNEAYCGG